MSVGTAHWSPGEADSGRDYHSPPPPQQGWRGKSSNPRWAQKLPQSFEKQFGGKYEKIKSVIFLAQKLLVMQPNAQEILCSVIVSTRTSTAMSLEDGALQRGPSIRRWSWGKGREETCRAFTLFIYRRPPVWLGGKGQGLGAMVTLRLPDIRADRCILPSVRGSRSSPLGVATWGRREGPGSVPKQLFHAVSLPRVEAFLHKRHERFPLPWQIGAFVTLLLY